MTSSNRDPFFPNFTSMAIRKFRSDHLFDGHTLMNDQHVLLTDESGKVEDVVPIDLAGDDVQYFPGIVTPGFVNCHCHLELSHLSGVVAQKTGLIPFLQSMMTQPQANREVVFEAIEKAETDMLANGIVAVGDICNTPMTLVQKSKGRLWYHNFIELAGAIPSVARQRFEQGLKLYSAFAQLYPRPAESISIVPHAPYSVTAELWELIVNHPGNRVLSLHNQESQAENDWFGEKSGDLAGFFEKMKIDVSRFVPTGSSSLRASLPRLMRNQSMILVHNVATGPEDVAFAKKTGLDVSWCLCPNANLYITGQLPAIDIFMAAGCNLVLGTDSLASNHQLSILEEIKTIRKYYPDIAVDQLLKWATINGAKALQMDRLLGSFEKGKKPGILVCDAGLTGVRRIL